MIIAREECMAVPENRRTSRNQDYLDDDDDRERVRGIGGGYTRPYGDRDRGWDEEYGGRRSGRYGPGQQPADDEGGRRHDRDRLRGWYGTGDYERYAAGGRYGSRYDDNEMPSAGSIPH